MFSPFLNKVRAIPARGADWTNRLGPVALMGIDGNIKGSAGAMLDQFRKSPPHTDYYSELQLVKPSTDPVDAPPRTVTLMPVVDCGMMDPSSSSSTTSSPQPATSPVVVDPSDYHIATVEATSEFVEKGFVPICVGGDGSSVLPMLEGFKRIRNEDDIVMIHMTGRPNYGDALSPVRIAIEKQLVKKSVGMCNRAVDKETREVRKDRKIHYLDAQALYMKGFNQIRDVRNDYPLFLSIDLDVLDPSVAPGVRHVDGGGLSMRELLHLLGSLRAPSVAGISIHGYDPSLDVYRQGDGAGITSIAAAKIIKESIGKAYSVTTMTLEEGISRFTTMRQQGSLEEYPQF